MNPFANMAASLVADRLPPQHTIRNPRRKAAKPRAKRKRVGLGSIVLRYLENNPGAALSTGDIMTMFDQPRRRSVNMAMWRVVNDGKVTSTRAPGGESESIYRLKAS